MGRNIKYEAEVLFQTYLLAHTSIVAAVLLCKLLYDLTHFLSNLYVKTYATLTKIQQIEWNNRAISTLHAIFITAVSFYFVFCSDLFSDRFPASITRRTSQLSTFSLGISVGYFIADLGMILWLYPSLGGLEYVVHHSISGIAVAYSMYSGEGQLYTFMILISEITTPEINIRWYLDIGGMKKSIAYLINGVVIFFAWLVARIQLFAYMFYHVYLHYDKVKQMHIFGYLLVMVVPSVLAVMNIVWFGKILKGLKKQLAKKR